jgi:thiol-disulfide isomerase/thioredoxin
MKTNLFVKCYFILLLAVLVIGCSSTKNKTEEYRIITGAISKNTLLTPESPWFERNYKSYVIPDTVITELKSLLKDDISFKVFAGTWCSDSRMVTPKYYKLMDDLGCENYEMIGLDRQKTSPEKIEKDYNITLVPTFIVFRGGKEIGRIIEHPSKSPHEDLIEMLKREN